MSTSHKFKHADQTNESSQPVACEPLFPGRPLAKKMPLSARFVHAVATRRVIVVSTTLFCLFLADLGVRRLRSTLQRYDGRYEPGEHYRKLAELENLESTDVVLVGSSRAMFAFVPEEFEKAMRRSVFNLGVSDAKTADWQIFTRRLLGHHRPRLIVLGVNAASFRHDYLPTKAAYLIFDWRDLLESCRREGVSSQVIGWYARQKFGQTWALFGSRSELKLLSQEKLSWLLPKYARLSRERRMRVTQSTPSGGYEHPAVLGRKVSTLQQVLDEGGKVHFPLINVPRFDPLASPFGRFGDLLATLRNCGVAVLVAYLSNSPRAESRWRGVEPRIKNRISEICREHGVSFLGCENDQLPRTNRDYVDEIHVTESFGRRISRYLARRIEEKHLLDFPEDRLAQLQDTSTTP